MRIRTKLVIALFIPIVALVALSGLAVSDAGRRAADADARAADVEAQVELANALSGPSGVIAALQKERNSEAIQMIGLSPEVLPALGGTAAEVRAADDAAIAQFVATIETKPRAVQDAYAPALAAVARVPELRAANDAYDGPRTLQDGVPAANRAFDGYAAVIEEVFDANTSVALALDDAELREGARVIDSLTRYADTATVLQYVVGNAALHPLGPVLSNDAEAFAETAALRDRKTELRTAIAETASPAYRAVAESVFASEPVLALDDLVDRALAEEPIDATEVSNTTLWDALDLVQRGAVDAAAELQADADVVRTTALAERDEASDRQRTVTLLAWGVVLAAVGVTFVASRSITRPLLRLTRDAHDVAARRLPDTVEAILDTPPGDDVAMPELAAIDRSGGYEIAEVAAALETVQRSAAELAVEQAVLRRNIADAFVHLGRRNQNLLSRQLDSITEMERAETDPDQLQQLFSLDHLATRMRRNAESLLLLAGLEPQRQWSAPVPLGDVLRGALGEVEDYERVAVTKLDPAMVAGTAVADLAHLVAELLENALNFSPPGRDVEVIGRSMSSGYTLAIVDHGVGMDGETLEQANVRLAGAESFTVAPSRYLGHYVVGRHAARLGVEVKLQPSPAGGVTAVLELAAVLAEDGPAAADPPGGDPPAASALTDAVDDLDRVGALDGAVDLDGVDDLDEVDAIDSVDRFARAGAYETTASGYRKRVRGANTPSTTVAAARGAAGDAGEVGGADGQRAALSGLQAGMQRARNDASAPDGRSIDTEGSER